MLLTRGAEGALVAARRRRGRASPRRAVAVVDTIGAGDAFGGGVLAWWRANGLRADDLARLEPVVEAARFAARVAARTCERPGAEPPLLRRARAAGLSAVARRSRSRLARGEGPE